MKGDLRTVRRGIWDRRGISGLYVRWGFVKEGGFEDCEEGDL